MSGSYWGNENSGQMIRWHSLAKKAFNKKISLSKLAVTAGIKREEAFLYFKSRKRMPSDIRERIELAIKIWDSDTPCFKKKECWDKLWPGLYDYFSSPK